MKIGLNKADVIKYHKMLKRGYQLPYIARKLHTSVEVLEAKTPEKVAEYKKFAKGREDAVNKQRASNRLAADVLSTTAAKVMGGQVLDPGAPATPPPADMASPPTEPGTPVSEGTPIQPPIGSLTL